MNHYKKLQILILAMGLAHGSLGFAEAQQNNKAEAARVPSGITEASPAAVELAQKIAHQAVAKQLAEAKLQHRRKMSR